MLEPNTLTHQFLDNEKKDKTREKKTKGKNEKCRNGSEGKKITRRKEDKGTKDEAESRRNRQTDKQTHRKD